jgi:hypothetical protein
MQATVETADLIRAIKAASVSMSSDPTRAHLAGVMFEAEADTLHVVATDGHTLIDVRLPARHADNYGRVFLPASRIKATIAHLKTFTCAEIDIATLVLDTIGRNDFPPWRNVIPTNEPHPSTHVSLAPAVLDVAVKAGKTLARRATKKYESTEGWEFRIREDLDPVVAEWRSARAGAMSVTLVLMPMRL